MFDTDEEWKTVKRSPLKSLNTPTPNREKSMQKSLVTKSPFSVLADLENEQKPSSPDKEIGETVDEEIEEPKLTNEPLKDRPFIRKNTLDLLLYVNCDEIIPNLDKPFSTAQEALEMVLKFQKSIEDQLCNDPNFGFYTFGHKTFSLVKKGNAGWSEAPYYLCPFVLKREFYMFVDNLKRKNIDSECFQPLLHDLIVELVDFNVGNTDNFSKETVSKQLIIQMLCSSFPNLFFADYLNGKSVCDLVFAKYSNKLATNAAVGNTLLWILTSQSLIIEFKSRFLNPKGFEIWLKYFMKVLVDAKTDHVEYSVQRGAVDYLDLLLKGIEYAKNAKMEHLIADINIKLSHLTDLIHLCTSGKSVEMEILQKTRPNRHAAILKDLKSFWRQFKEEKLPKMNYFMQNSSQEFILKCLPLLKPNQKDLTDVFISIVSMHQPARDAWLSIYSDYPTESKLALCRILELSERRSFWLGKFPVWSNLNSPVFSKFCKNLSKLNGENQKLVKKLRSRLPSTYTGPSLVQIVWFFTKYYMLLSALFMMTACPVAQDSTRMAIQNVASCPIDTLMAQPQVPVAIQMTRESIQLVKTKLTSYLATKKPLLNQIVEFSNSYHLDLIKVNQALENSAIQLKAKSELVYKYSSKIVKAQLQKLDKVDFKTADDRFKDRLAKVQNAVRFGLRAVSAAFKYSVGKINSQELEYWRNLISFVKKDYENWRIEKELY